MVGRLPIEVKGPTGVDVVLRRKGSRCLVHLINRNSGLPNQPNAGAIDEIPPAGPVHLRLKCARRPRRVAPAFEPTAVRWTWKPGRGGVLLVTVPSVAVHLAVVVEN